MKYLIYVLLCAVVIISCKKDEDEPADNPLYVDFKVSGNTGVTTLPSTAHFVTNIPDSADQATWDFGDGATATGFSVNHTYPSYGNYIVTLTASKGSRSGSIVKTIPVTIYKKFQVNRLEILSIDPYTSAGTTWDPGNDSADVTALVSFPNGVVYDSLAILQNADTGTIYIIPPASTTALEGAVRIELFDVDTTNGSTQYNIMSTLSFKISEFVKPVFPYSTDTILQTANNNTRVRVIMSWVP